MFCNKCGRKVEDNANFCPSCGNNFNSIVTESNNLIDKYPVKPASNSNQYSNQFNNNGFSKQQKAIIGVLLFIFIAILGYGLFGKESILFKKDDTRTIMIYLDGSDLESKSGIVTADLMALDASKIDLSKTTILIHTGGTEKWQNDFISSEENAIFLFTEDGFKKVHSYERQSVGNPKTLSDFLEYGYNNYKAGHYNLILYDHGGAIDGAIYDDFFLNDNLSLKEFGEALKDSPFNSKNKFDAVVFRTCLNGTLEVASIFDDYSEYIVFSEEVTFGGNSSDVLSFIHNVTPSDDGIEFGKKFIKRYQEQVDDLDFFGAMDTTYSIVDLSKIDNVIKELDSFVKGINIENCYNNISKIRGNLYQYGSNDSEYFDTVDLYTLVEQIEKYSSVSSDKLKKALDEAIVYNHTNLQNSTGMSIYFPYNGKMYINKFLNVYNQLDFSDYYRSLIKNFYEILSSGNKMSFSLGEDETIYTDTNEVSIKLTDEEYNNFSRTVYTVFKKDTENPNYYQVIYNSDDIDLSDDGTITTKISNNPIKFTTDGETNYLPIKYTTSDGNGTNRFVGIVENINKDFTDKDNSFVVNLKMVNSNNKPKISSASVKTTDDGLIQGNYIDLKDYNYLTVICSRYKLFDEEGKILNEWEPSEDKLLYRNDIDNFDFDYSEIDYSDGEYYVLFNIYDINNESHYSNLIRIEK